MCDTDTANTANTEAPSIPKIVRSDSNSSAPVCRVCYEGTCFFFNKTTKISIR